MDMIFEVSPNERPKVPTLLQWLKTESSAKLRAKYHCTIIWFPGNYPNLTFQTECFRVLVHENHPIFDQCLAFARNMASQDTQFAIVVNGARDGGFGITTSGEKGVWEPIGESGVRWVADTVSLRSPSTLDQPKPSRRRRAAAQPELPTGDGTNSHF